MSAELDMVLTKANVPEHSVLFMQAMSGAEPFLEGSYLFFAAADRLYCIGYCLEGTKAPQAFEEALAHALKRTHAKKIRAICPVLPERLKSHRCNQDQYFILAADASIAPRLDHFADRAAVFLKVDQSVNFTQAHRRLWAEFMGRKALPADVQHLFEQTEKVLSKTPDLMLLNGWDGNGHLAACLLVDTAPKNFNSYLLGAYSRTHYTPYATDLLFRYMLSNAREDKKAYLQLGLGVNSGIRRFKTKWGAKPGLSYEMARWREKKSLWPGIGDFAQVLAATQMMPVSKRKFLAGLPSQRRLTMLWAVEKEGRCSFVGGTAHFFRYSFENFLRSIFEKVDTVLFEGPLDAVSLGQVSAIGHRPEKKSPRLIGLLTRDQIKNLTRVVCGPTGFLARFGPAPAIEPSEVRNLLAQTRHWLAFFSLWSGFLSRMGWNQSVDLEAWHLAHDMGKAVSGMETIAEQVSTLEKIPVENIVDFLQRCRGWGRFSRLYEKAYLEGDIERILHEIRMFPTRTGNVIFYRDAIFVKRMLPFLKRGPCAVFVGAAHLPNICRMLSEAGFNVRKCK